MATRCSAYSIMVPIEQSKKSISKSVKVHMSQMQPSKVSASLIKRPLTIKDQAKGIVCYRDGKGELICEGYDEGPRCINTYQQRCQELQIPDFLTQRWLHILHDQN